MIGLYLCRQRPTLPHTFACSTIGPAGLNLRRLEGVSEPVLRAGAFCRNPERSEGSALRRFAGVSEREPAAEVLSVFQRMISRKRKRPSRFLSMASIYAGNDLLSHTLSRAVQSALRGLTSVFGMGTGGSPAVRSPTNLFAQSAKLLALSS